MRTPRPTLETFESVSVFTVPDLARIAGIHRHRMRRLLESGGVAFAKSGQDLVVLKVELRNRMPALWDSLLLSRHDTQCRAKADQLGAEASVCDRIHCPILMEERAHIIALEQHMSAASDFRPDPREQS